MLLMFLGSSVNGLRRLRNMVILDVFEMDRVWLISLFSSKDSVFWARRNPKFDVERTSKYYDHSAMSTYSLLGV